MKSYSRLPRAEGPPARGSRAINVTCGATERKRQRASDLRPVYAERSRVL